MRRFRGRNRQVQSRLPDHLRETENHLKRQGQVSQLAGLKARELTASKEASEVAGEVGHDSVLDAALMTAQAVSTTRWATARSH